MSQTVGIDLVDIERIDLELSGSPNALELVLTKEELRGSSAQIAGNFAAKEALFKALGSQFHLSPLDVRVSRSETGMPFFEFVDSSNLNSRFSLSLSYTNTLVIAVVVGINPNSHHKDSYT